MREQKPAVGEWVRLTTDDGKVYIARIEEHTQIGGFIITMALRDARGLYLQQTWLTPGEMVSWSPTDSPLAKREEEGTGK